MIFRYLIFVFCVGSIFSLFGQNPVDPVRFVVPAPDAMALGKYGNTPVSMYTGTANVSIPIYTIKEGMLEMPIVLNYGTGGIKVADISPWTGTGWTLSGAVITRVVYGMPDELRLNSAEKSIDFDPIKEKQEQYMQNIKDSQRDVFYFNFNGRSGRFVLNDNFEAQIAPYQKLRITATKQEGVRFSPDDTPLGPPRMSVTEWQIVDESGIIYTFSAYEKSQSYSRFSTYSSNGLVGNFGTATGGDPSLWNYSVSAWNLTKITSPVGDEIALSYSDRKNAYDTPCEATSYLLNQTVDDKYAGQIKKGTISSQRQFNDVKRLVEITFSSGSLVFEESSVGRADLIGDKFLQRIVLKNSEGIEVRHFTLNYKYLVPGGQMIDPGNINTSGQSNFFDYPPGDGLVSSTRRLMLTSVEECEADGDACKRYQLFYNTQQGLPSRNSMQTDHWGFFNNYQGVSSNEILPEFVKNGENFILFGKQPSLWAAAGSLRQIIYPTGGSTTFNYELNDCISKFLPYPFRDKLPVSLYIDYTRYNNLGYQFTDGPPPVFDDTSMNRLYYNSFEVDDLKGWTHLILEVKNFPENPGVMGYYIENENTGILEWYMADDFMRQLQYDPASRTFSGQVRIQLNNGRYRLYHAPPRIFGTTPGSPGYVQPYHLTILPWREEFIVKEETRLRDVGGLRISQIVNYDPFEGRSLTKTYRYVDSDGVSSGQVLTDLIYLYSHTEVAIHQERVNGLDVTEVSEINYQVFKSSPIYPFLTTQGSYVGYARVEEIEGAVGGPVNGKNVYLFTSPNQYPDYYAQGTRSTSGNIFPFGPADNFDWLRGRITEETKYGYDGNAYQPIYHKRNWYGPPQVVSISQSLKCDYRVKAVNPAVLMAYLSELIYNGPYNFTSGYSNLLSTEEWQHSGDQIFKKVSNYGYSGSNLMTNYIKTTSSDGDILETEIKYSSDYQGLHDSDSVAHGVKNLVDRHIINTEIENSKYVKKSAGSRKLVSSVFNVYRTKQPLISQILQIEDRDALPDFLSSAVESGAISKDSRYVQKIIYDVYGSKGSVRQYHKTNDVNHAYLWDSKYRFPIAHAINAAWNQVFFTGFEETGIRQDVSSPAKSGVRYWSSGNFNFSGNAGFSPANSSQLVMSYWYWLAGAWHFSDIVPFSNTIARGERLDDVRVYPRGSQLTTYTYDDLNGMTSATDANNVSTHYLHDDLGRLRYLRDNDKAIIKKIEYYYGQKKP